MKMNKASAANTANRVHVVSLRSREVAPFQYALDWSMIAESWQMAWSQLRNARIHKECTGISVTRYGKNLGGMIQHFGIRCNCSQLIERDWEASVGK
jgi:hypothetical protein